MPTPSAIEAAPPALPTPASEPSTELTVIARLVERHSAPGCGVLHIKLVMRYEILEVVEGTYTGRDLYVAHSCPEMGADRCRDVPGQAVRGFRNGDVHRMRVQRRRWGSYMDLFADKQLPRYYARCANLVPPESP
ncbi:hypothetical protein [Nannocystis punicea]|uniref:Uncharacterized protein n=1 Tax=Nannocystis punicea TaxID=2995304 RepID=A0ABY7GSE1_9BACT|nr:hypothetical protein [Nannocystis poenicansa]WAS89857.1 hypothetical protein O0S08_27000 [Nannocystis poenicansa]